MKNEIRMQGDTATVYLYDIIGDGFFEDGVSAEEFVTLLDGLKVKRIDLRINSPGGSVFDANTMYNALTRNKATVYSYIDGLAASAASYVAMAGDVIEMAENSQMMIHNAWMIFATIGDSEEIMAEAVRKTDMLRKVNDSIIKTYAARTGRDEQQIRDWMAAETYFTPTEAKESGFADEIGQPLKIAAASYDKALLLAALTGPAPAARPAAIEQPAVPEDLLRAIQWQEAMDRLLT